VRTLEQQVESQEVRMQLRRLRLGEVLATPDFNLTLS